ncbi:MAG: dephospho-CoA kinase [Gemmatimonadetes bacterium]|nr:dephospho-CoA kinase [Gemmatimonadota bacterium]
MLNVALTGNVAAGKSIVAQLFKKWGATLIDSDVIVRELQQPGSEVLDQIVQTFGADILLHDGTLDRAALRHRVMSDAAARRSLNAIVHPAVLARRQIMEEAARARGDAILVSDIPLLFEAADPEAFDVIVLVDAPPMTRKARLVEKRGLDPLEADRLLAAQDPTETKRERSDYLIDNDGTPAELERAARAVWQALEARAD